MEWEDGLLSEEFPQKKGKLSSLRSQIKMVNTAIAPYAPQEHSASLPVPFGDGRVAPLDRRERVG